MEFIEDDRCIEKFYDALFIRFLEDQLDVLKTKRSERIKKYMEFKEKYNDTITLNKPCTFKDIEDGELFRLSSNKNIYVKTKKIKSGGDNSGSNLVFNAIQITTHDGTKTTATFCYINDVTNVYKVKDFNPFF